MVSATRNTTIYAKPDNLPPGAYVTKIMHTEVTVIGKKEMIRVMAELKYNGKLITLNPVLPMSFTDTNSPLLKFYNACTGKTGIPDNLDTDDCVGCDVKAIVDYIHSGKYDNLRIKDWLPAPRQTNLVSDTPANTGDEAPEPVTVDEGDVCDACNEVLPSNPKLVHSVTDGDDHFTFCRGCAKRQGFLD